MYIAAPAASASALLTSWPPFLGGGVYETNGTTGEPGEPGLDLPSNWSSLIGIVTAIIGNVLIALALNVQRYAHIQLEKQRQENRERARRALKDAANGRRGGGGGGGANSTNSINGINGTNGTNGTNSDGNYGALGGSNVPYRDSEDEPEGRRSGETAVNGSESQPLVRNDSTRWADGPAAAEAGRTAAGSPDSNSSGSSSDAAGSTSYLRSPYWWLGQVLITVGESGNFLAYGFAPASIVSPLGVVALISNCVIAPILFKERFRMQDFWGVLVAIGGAVTVVLSAKQEETKLAPHDVWDAITTPAFEVYVAVTCSLIALLMWASPRYGHRTILIDLGLVGLFGAYTVLATKGVSSMLSSTLFGAFMTPMTYSLIVILLGTAVMQVRYVNKALQRFDSTQVIPIQFVMFTLSVIIGSAVLYRDFERTTAEQAAKFVGGCLLTFFGVFVITSGRPPSHTAADDDDNSEADMEAEAVAASGGRTRESFSLEESRPHSTDGSRSPAQTPPAAPSSRRPSRASRASFSGNGKPFVALLSSDTGVPSSRVPPSAVPRILFPATPEEENEDVRRDGILPLLDNPWRNRSPDRAVSPAATVTGAEGGDAPALRPTLGTPAYSDSVLSSAPTIASMVVEGTAGSASASASAAERPVTPVAALRPYTTHFQSPMISPSPLLSSTVSTVVADTILKHMDGPVPHMPRRLSNRRQRQGLRSSLFVPQDELDGAEWLMQPFLGQQIHHYPPYRDALSEDAPAETDAAAAATAGDADRDGHDPADGHHDLVAHKEAGRARTRSFSTALGSLFWPRRKRRNTSPETGNGRAAGHIVSSTDSPVRTDQDYTDIDDPPPTAAV